jgi:hypothetical protein
MHQGDIIQTGMMGRSDSIVPFAMHYILTSPLQRVGVHGDVTPVWFINYTSHLCFFHTRFIRHITGVLLVSPWTGIFLQGLVSSRRFSTEIISHPCGNTYADSDGSDYPCAYLLDLITVTNKLVRILRACCGSQALTRPPSLHDPDTAIWLHK